MIYGKWLVQASKQANIHTHGCNEVTLVWGSLRLAPISMDHTNDHMDILIDSYNWDERERVPYLVELLDVMYVCLYVHLFIPYIVL